MMRLVQTPGLVFAINQFWPWGSTLVHVQHHSNLIKPSFMIDKAINIDQFTEEQEGVVGCLVSDILGHRANLFTFPFYSKANVSTFPFHNRQ